MYSKIEELMSVAIKDRSDVLPEEIQELLIRKYSEIPMFDGIYIKGENAEDNIIENILKLAVEYKKDLDFQIMVSNRRKTIRLKQKEALKDQEVNM